MHDGQNENAITNKVDDIIQKKGKHIIIGKSVGQLSEHNKTCGGLE